MLYLNLSKLYGAAKGLEYLHTRNVVHGNGKQCCLLYPPLEFIEQLMPVDSQMCKDAEYQFCSNTDFMSQANILVSQTVFLLPLPLSFLFCQL
jgi:hypothetical protein